MTYASLLDQNFALAGNGGSGTPAFVSSCYLPPASAAATNRQGGTTDWRKAKPMIRVAVDTLLRRRAQPFDAAVHSTAWDHLTVVLS